MEFSFSTELINELKKLKKKQLTVFKKNIRHPSLRTHKLKGNLSNAWSISIEGNIRMIYTIKNNQAIFFKIGNHDEVYRK